MIYPEVRIGNEFRAYANVTVRERVIIGDRVTLQSGCVIGGDGLDIPADLRSFSIESVKQAFPSLTEFMTQKSHIFMGRVTSILLFARLFVNSYLPHLRSFDSIITIPGQARELDGADTWDDILHRPLLSQDVKKLKAGRTDVSAIRDGIRIFSIIGHMIELWSDKIGMVGRVNHEDSVKIKGLADAMTLKPSPLKFLFDGLDFVPYSRLSSLEGYRLDQFSDFSEGGQSVGFKIRFRNERGIF